MSDINELVSKKIEEILSSIQKVSSMYVEPGDVILVTVDKDADEEKMSSIRKVMSHVFTDNPGLLLASDVEVRIVKKDEAGESASPAMEDLKKEIESLKKQVEALSHQISIYYLDV